MISLLESPRWQDYELLDSGDGLKLERFGAYRFVRPEAQAMWQKTLSAAHWNEVDGIFQPSSEESGGHWELRKKIRDRWEMSYPLETSKTPLRFRVMTTPGRHLGVFPETGAHWDWYAHQVADARRPVKVLNLFGYTGLASLACAAVGASVTHIDASKKSVTWGRENQALSGLSEKPIRWIVDDALKFVEREARRGAQYDALILDPPKFGRGPKGEIWEIYKALPPLLQACRALLSTHPLFVALTMYAVRASAIHLQQSLAEMMTNFEGRLEAGELVTRESHSAGRLLSHAVYTRWNSL